MAPLYSRFELHRLALSLMSQSALFFSFLFFRNYPSLSNIQRKTVLQLFYRASLSHIDQARDLCRVHSLSGYNNTWSLSPIRARIKEKNCCLHIVNWAIGSCFSSISVMFFKNSARFCRTQCDFHFITRHPLTIAQLHVTTGKHGWQLWPNEQNFYNNHCVLRQEYTQISVTYFSNIQLSIVRGCICCTTSGKQTSQLLQLKSELKGIFSTVVCDWGMWTRMLATKRNIPRRYGTLYQNISRLILSYICLA